MASRKIFIVGSGRSGTHWLGRTLESHPDVHATVEEPAIFDRSTMAALDPRIARKAVGYLLGRYAVEHLRARPKSYVDKSHPNLWHVESLARAFPRARFLGIQRSAHGTVASMLSHDGVLEWHRRWREFPVPNRFLGITPENVGTYDALPLASKCALRWRAHRDRLLEVQRRYPDRVLVVDYEAMTDDYPGCAERIWQFVGLRPVPVTQEVRAESRDRWRTQLTPEEVAAVDAVIS